ncbi:MAG: VWA domain-containing protein [Verrucomicrobia bacterium]|nr:MAG: VWA domain-containing protein [Verrucomicrobiota bacterium]
MSFLAPMAFVFAAALPVVVVFYLLKRKRVVKLVSSTVLWQRFLAETRASAPFQKLRHNWLLVLQLLMLALVVLAMARPYFTGPLTPGGLQVVILDGSASMQATDVQPSRFAAARRQALALVDGMRPHDQMAVLLAAAQTEVKQSPTSNKAALRRAINACEPIDGPGGLAEALRLAQSLTRDRVDAAIHLFSDGAVAGLDEFENAGLNLLYHRVGESADNRGIVALDVRPHPEDPTRQAVFVTVLNAATNRVTARLELYFEGAMLEARAIEFAGRETVSEVFSVEQQTDGVYELRLNGGDALPVDDVAWAIGRLPRPLKVLLVTAGNRFLEKALLAQRRVELSTTTTLDHDPEEFDLTVLDNIVPAVWPGGNVLTFRAAPPEWVQTDGVLENPPIVDWKNTHPLLRFITLDNVAVLEAAKVVSAPWAETLVESTASPLLLAGELNQRRIVYVAFDVLQSTWPLRISFPIFIANALQWLDPTAREATRWQIHPGEPLRLTLPEPAESVTVRLPDGQTRSVRLPEGSRQLVFGETARRGLYEVREGTNTFRFCANLLDQQESDITPRTELKLGRFAAAKNAEEQVANLELWRWIAAAGLLVLLFEWWWYHKRSV